MAFDEILFPTNISQGSQGGPGWQTDRVTVNSGHEIRNQNWADPLYTFNATFGVRTQADLEALIQFFMARKGMARGFRYKDWSDYVATNEVLVPTGAPTVQLIKTYTSGGQSYARNISKPLAASPAVTMRLATVSFTDFTIDTTTGIITLTPASSTATVTGITVANPGVVTTSSAHGFSNGDKIWHTGVVGMTEVNSKIQTIAGVTSTTYQIEDTTTFTAYSSAGTASKYIQPAEVLDWAGEFDVPVRFDTDTLPATWEAFEVNRPDDIPLIEVRDIT